MSLLRLLADFPNYSARKVRRLANQLKWLEGSQDPQAKNIAADLMDYNMQSAQLEERLNDDVRVEVPLPNMVPVSEALCALQDFKMYSVEQFGPHIGIDQTYTYLHDRLNGPMPDKPHQTYVKAIDVDELNTLFNRFIEYVRTHSDVSVNESWTAKVDELRSNIKTAEFAAYRVYAKDSTG